jgi:hypothetical protein
MRRTPLRRGAFPWAIKSKSKNDAVTLYGELVMPAKHKPSAGVVLQYGSGRESAVANNFVQHLLPLQDIAVFVFDKRVTIQREHGPEGRRLAGRTADGYFDLLVDWIVGRASLVRGHET